MWRNFSLAVGLSFSLAGCGETPKEFAQMGQDLLDGKVTEQRPSDCPMDVLLNNYEQRK